MTSPFLLARKPKEEQKPLEEVGQTTRRPSSFNIPTQLTTPPDVEPRPIWKQRVDAQRVKIDTIQQNNTITPSANVLRDNYTNIFPIIRAIGETAETGQLAGTAARNAREAAVAQAKINAANQAAIEDAYRRIGQIQTGAPGPTSSNGGMTYSGDVVWDKSDAALADLMRKAGFPESAISVGLGISIAENSLRDNTIHMNPNGSQDLGIFQINNKAHADKLAAVGNNWTDPQTNVNLAYQIWKEAGGSWSPWTTFRSGYTARPVPTTRLTVTATPTNNGGVYTTGNGTLRNAVVNRAMVVENLPYAWGGSSLTTGADCSGLVYAVYKELGIPIPGRQDANAYSKEGVVGHRVASVNELKPGDLIAFQWAGGYRGAGAASHIAIYAGNGQIIEEYGPDGVKGRRRPLTNSSQDRGAIYISVKFPGE